MIPLGLTALLFGITPPALAQRANLSFETPSSENPQRARDWKFQGAGYHATLDTSAREGSLSLRLSQARSGGIAGVSQAVPAAELVDAGAAERLRAHA